MMVEVERRRIGKTGLTARAVGVGWAAITGLRDRESTATIRRAIEVGFDFHDTSSMYADSERRVGLALEGGWREKVILQTKAGYHRGIGGYDYSGPAIRSSVENSLRMLKTDYLDSVLVHDPEDIEAALGPGRAFDVLHRLKEEGVIGHVGLGVRGIAQHLRAMEAGVTEIHLTHMDYTLLDQEAGQVLFPALKKQGGGVLIASPLKRVLAGPEPDRAEAPEAHAMWSWCRDRGANLRDLALQLCLRAPIEAIVLTGPASVRQVEENWASAHAEVPADLWAEFKAEFGVVEYDGSLPSAPA